MSELFRCGIGKSFDRVLCSAEWYHRLDLRGLVPLSEMKNEAEESENQDDADTSPKSEKVALVMSSTGIFE